MFAEPQQSPKATYGTNTPLRGDILILINKIAELDFRYSIGVRCKCKITFTTLPNICKNNTKIRNSVFYQRYNVVLKKDFHIIKTYKKDLRHLG